MNTCSMQNYMNRLQIFVGDLLFAMLMQTCALSPAVSFEVDMHMFVKIRQVSKCFYSTQTALIFRLNNSQIQKQAR